MKSFKNGVFYTLGKFFILLLIGIIGFFIASYFNIDLSNYLVSNNDNVFAVTSTNGWYFPKNFNYLGAYSQTSLNSSSSNEFRTSVVEEYSDNLIHPVYWQSQELLGRYVSFGVPIMNNNYAYMVSIYLCANYGGNLPSFDKLYFGSSITDMHDDLDYNLTSRALHSKPVGSIEFGECRVYNIKTEISGGGRRFIGFHLSAPATYTIHYFGYQFYPLGTATGFFGALNEQMSQIGNSVAGSKTEIINSVNSAKNNIIANQNSNTQAQISNDNNNTDRLISNANANTDREISNMNDDNENEIKTQGNDFFDSFGSQSYGLSDIIRLPLTYLSHMSDGVCTPLTFQLPFVHNQVTLPCPMTIYSQFPTFLNLWQTITTGIIAYWVCVNLFAMFKGFKDPVSDKVEVLDL